jgi:hypothetical protein
MGQGRHHFCRRRRRSLRGFALAVVGLALVALVSPGLVSAEIDNGGGGGDGSGGGGGTGKHATATTVSCLAVQLQLADGTTCTATVRDTLDPPTDLGGEVTFSIDDAGNVLTPGACNLQKGADGQFTCSVEYRAGTVGVRHLVAHYVGDGGHGTSTSDPLEISVTLPPEPPGGGSGGGGGESGGGGNQGGGAASPPAPRLQPPPPPEPVFAPAPDTTVKRQPPRKTANRWAKFTFLSSQAGSTFECKLDGRPFKLCASPYKANVTRGPHTLRVRAVNSRGSADPTPLVLRWKVG